MFFKRQKSEPETLEERISEVFRKPPILESERLIYKKILPENAADMYDYSKKEEVTRYLLWTPHLGLAQTERYIKLLQKKYANGSFWDFGLTYRENGKFIGTCGITSCDEKDNSIEIGYVLAPEYWGMGLATEAAGRVLRFAFETFEPDKVLAKFIEGNGASRRVMQKLGMTLEGVYQNSMYVKGEYRTIHVYEIGREEFWGKIRANSEIPSTTSHISPEPPSQAADTPKRNDV